MVKSKNVILIVNIVVLKKFIKKDFNYVLDEPSIGLHQRDNDRLIKTLKHLRDLGNTVLVVEHDEETIAAADFLVDVGPGAGVHGGEIVAAGTPYEGLGEVGKRSVRSRSPGAMLPRP